MQRMRLDVSTHVSNIFSLLGLFAPLCFVFPVQNGNQEGRKGEKECAQQNWFL